MCASRTRQFVPYPAMLTVRRERMVATAMGPELAIRQPPINCLGEPGTSGSEAAVARRSDHDQSRSATGRRFHTIVLVFSLEIEARGCPRNRTYSGRSAP